MVAEVWLLGRKNIRICLNIDLDGKLMSKAISKNGKNPSYLETIKFSESLSNQHLSLNQFGKMVKSLVSGLKVMMKMNT